MKNIAKSLVIIIAVAAVASFATYSYFSDQGTVSGVTFSTGNADLQMTQVYMHNWMQNGTANELDIHFPQNIYPGYQGSWGHPDGVMYLGNFSQSNIDLVVKTHLTNYSQNVSNLNNVIEMAMAWGGSCDPGGVGTGFHTLDWWINNPTTLFTGAGSDCGYIPNNHSGGYDGYSRAVKFYLKIPSTAGNEIQGANVSFNIQFDAEQKH